MSYVYSNCCGEYLIFHTYPYHLNNVNLYKFPPLFSCSGVVYSIWASCIHEHKKREHFTEWSYIEFYAIFSYISVVISENVLVSCMSCMVWGEGGGGGWCVIFAQIPIY